MVFMDKKLEPELQFNFSSEWNKKKLEDIIEISKEKYNPNSDKKNYKCIELEHISQETGLLLGYTDSINQNSIKNKFHKENILFGKLRPYLKKFYYPNFDGVCSSEIWVFNTQEYSKYIYYLIQTKKFLDISNVSSGSKMPRSDWNFMKEYTFLIPDKKTQIETANLFSRIDDKILLLNNKYKSYQDFKKYLMQNIFTHKLRFDFDEEWEYRNFTDIFKTVSTKKYQIKSAEIQDTGDFEVIDQGQNEIAGYFSDKDKLCLELPIIIYGDHTTFVKYRDKPFIVGADGVKLLLPKIDVDLKYLFYALEHFNIKPEGYKRHFSILKKINLPIPNLEEQNKISQMFINIDMKLKFTQTQLQDINEFKRGLLQQMFV